jgi:hypothetical protein
MDFASHRPVDAEVEIKKIAIQISVIPNLALSER